MVKKILIFTITILAAACSNDSEPIMVEELTGTWLLIEVLVDPGDGSGEFKPVTSDKKLAFFSNGQFVVNRTLCYMNTGSEQKIRGIYDTTKMVIIPDNCKIGSGNSQLELSYKLEGPNLILHFPCIEPCAEKYVKVE